MCPLETSPFVEVVTSFASAVYLESPIVVTIDAERAFKGVKKKISFFTTKVLLCTDIGDLSGSKKLYDWETLNAVLLSPFTKAVILKGEMTPV